MTDEGDDDRNNQEIQPETTRTRHIPIGGMIQPTPDDSVVHPSMTPETANSLANTSLLLTLNNELMQDHKQSLTEMQRDRENIDESDIGVFERLNRKIINMENRIERLRTVIADLMQTQLLSFEQSPTDGSTPDENQRFQCPICCEFMQDPATCGKCSPRFCYLCIFKAVTDSPVGHCPTCRLELTSEKIQRDDALCQEIQHAPTISCTNEGCDAVLQLTEVQAHEAQCGFVRLRCRYAPFGCAWKVPRHNLRLHEDGCVARVSHLEELVRQSRADHQHIIGNLQDLLSGTTAMVDVHSQLIGQFHPHPTNLIDLLDIVYTATCTPAVLLFTNDFWRMFLAYDQGRAAVSNFLYLLPTFVLIARCSTTCYRLFLAVGEVKDSWDPTKQVLIPGTIVLLGVLIAVCFILDNASCTTFSKYTLRHVEHKFLEEIAALALCVIVFIMIGFDATFIKAGTVWILMCLSTCFFPPIVTTILCQMSGATGIDISTEKLLVTGRAAAVVIFGLRYGLLVHILGFLPVLDSFFMWQLAMRQFDLPSAWNKSMACELLLQEILWDFQLYYVGTRSAVKALELTVDKRSALDTLLVLFLLPVLNRVVVQLTFCGFKMGNKLFQSAQTELLPDQMSVHNAYNEMGVACCACWMMQLCGIALSY